MWINSADDFINPPELGIAEKMVHQMPNAKFVLIPISDKTRGHGTHTQAAIWQNYLVATPQRIRPQTLASPPEPGAPYLASEIWASHEPRCPTARF